MDNYSIIIEETIQKGIKHVTSCCSSFVAMLPNEALPFAPAFALGLFVASAVLIWLVQKETKEPLYDVIKQFLQQLFTVSPSFLQEAEKVKIIELHQKVCLRYNAKNTKHYSKRLKSSLQQYVENAAEGNLYQSKDKKQNVSVFYISDLTSVCWWNEYDILNHEKNLLMKQYTKIREEFDKIFADFQKGICKQWQKVEVQNGHSCIFPLISRGVINTRNCSSCPTTFQVSMLLNYPKICLDSGILCSL